MNDRINLCERVSIFRFVIKFRVRSVNLFVFVSNWKIEDRSDRINLNLCEIVLKLN